MKGLKESTVGKMAGASPFRRTSRRLLLVASALAVTLIIVLFHKSASANTEAWTAEMTVGSNDQLNFTKVGFLNIPDDLDGGLWDETGRLDNTTITYEGQDCCCPAITSPYLKSEYVTRT